MIDLVPTEVWVAVGGLVSAVVALLVGRRQGRKKQQVEHRIKRAEVDQEKREKIDAAIHQGGGADAARERLRQRRRD